MFEMSWKGEERMKVPSEETTAGPPWWKSVFNHSGILSLRWWREVPNEITALLTEFLISWYQVCQYAMLSALFTEAAQWRLTTQGEWAVVV